MNMLEIKKFKNESIPFQIKNFADGMACALHDSMEADPSVVTFGLGATDPKSIFGTTRNLKERFGVDRVFDTPVSENATTGMAVGLAISGFKPVLTHQRLDFSLLSIDQIVNSAAKWNFMFGGRQSVPLVIRMVIGQGWGQGPTHSQALQSWFAQTPGLKVIMPAFPEDGYNLLRSSIEDPNPVLFLEHRWLHQIKWEGHGRKALVSPITQSNNIHSGDDVTIIAYSVGSIYALNAAKILKKLNIGLDVIDAYNLRQLDVTNFSKSVKKTGRLITVDFSHEFCSVGTEIIARLINQNFSYFMKAPERLALPNFPVGTAHSVEKDFYFTTFDICKKVLAITDNVTSENMSFIKEEFAKLQPTQFVGPF